MSRSSRCLCVLAALLILAPAAFAQVAPEKRPDVAEKVHRNADLDIPAFNDSLDRLPASAAAQARQRLSALGIAETSARVDRRSGRFATLLPTTPLVPGRGVGNNLTWSDVAPAPPKSRGAAEAAALNAFLGYLNANRDALGIDPSELSDATKITAHNSGDLFQVYVPRTFDGIPVRGSYVTAVIGQGNLTLMSAHQWGDRGNASSRPELGVDQARLAAESYLSPLKTTREWGKSELVYVPMARGKAPQDVAFGQGYRYQLAWSVKTEIDGDLGRYETLVDAHTGEILANVDTNEYAEAKGGVLPVTNDGIVPDGVEQPGWPMPFLDISTGSGTVTTDTGGNALATGGLTAALEGPFLRMNDNCGAISLTQTDNLDFGASSGTDCTTPGFGGPGNTHASRTGFYELNKVIEMARGQLPGNGWLQSKLTSNMNINSTCNAFWNGTVNFYRSGGGCSNTGEIAGVFDHEWGHGMDANDATPGIASPSGEGVADIYTALRLNDSCIGRNFRSTVCSGNGDPCLTCTGVRDIDYLARQSGQPHDYSWSNANCGGSVHCVGGVYSEAVWSLWKRKLQSAPYNYDNNTAHEIVTRLTFIGAGATGTWFSGGPPEGGCTGSSGYMNYLAADDDNGNLNDGTPHMTAIFEAFNDQEIACSTPTVQDGGCAGTPTVAPTVTTGNGNQLVTLSWGAVSGATKYGVYRTEGVFACDFGKVKLGETTGTTWNDTGLQNGRDYSYVVIPMGTADSCFGPASACATEQPVGQPDFFVSCSPASHNIQQGAQATSTCTVTSTFGYSGTVGLSCSGNPADLACSFSPASITPPVDGSASSTLTMTVDLAATTGVFNFDVVGNDGTSTRTSGIEVLIVPEGTNGPQDAAYDAGLGAPKCAIAGSECDSVALLDGRGSLGPEANQPNTLDTCTDGTSGTYHSDESNDRIVVRTLDGTDFVEGATVEVETTVWAWSTGSSDTLDLYYAADANNPSWTLVGSFSPPGGGAQVLTAQYVLPAGSMQAVRANFRYQGTQSSCSGGNFDDADDLVFAVGGGAPECSVDADCNDGLFCNGSETCNAGSCQSGAAVVCDDGVSCTVDVCDELVDSCTSTTDDSLCNDGLFCTGTETCDLFLGCQAGSDPCGGDFCDESTDSCGTCAPKGDACDVNSDCCSNKCRGPSGGKTCK